MKKLTLILVLILAASMAFAGAKKEDTGLPWVPEKPITIIVPWSAGGSTDQLARIIAGEIEDPLGQKIVIQNQPGASGSVGSQSCLDAPRDGYTWTAGAAVDIGVYKILGLIDSQIEDWNLFLGVANVMIVSVNPDSPYQTFDDLMAAFKAKPGQVSVATAGQSSAGHIAMEIIKKYTGVEYKMIPYDGGNPAVIATVAGEAEVVTQLAVEQADMLRAGKLRALAVLSDTDMNMKGVGVIPSIKKWLPEYATGPNYFGIWTPKGVPEEVIETFSILWEKYIVNSQVIKDYADERGAIFTPHWGEDAQERAMSYISPVAWLYYDAGKAKASPETIGISRP
ncbi:MAG: tripartite tricarboxylate transporter substrate binding protein [Spirochaetales bacterium]|nr:tripartite tricarboxylate transporter substrate binding protein [Spirochaetales bacterium]